MGEDNVVAIKIIKEIPFFGEGDSLVSRLKKVTLRGFPEVKIYESANFRFNFLTPDEIRQELHTPQPNIYQDNLGRVERLYGLFKEKGIDILKLDRAYDFEAQSSGGNITKWTMIPPVVEQWAIPSRNGFLDYTSLVGDKLAAQLQSLNLGLNPEVAQMRHTSKSGIYNLINDGTHRIHYGLLNGGVKILHISNITPGYPYYAAPQTYNVVQIVPKATDETTAMKKHVVQSPGQKGLYRQFPSGGILSGEVRPATPGETFI